MVKDHIAARRKDPDSDEEEVQPYSGKTKPQAFLYKSKAKESIDDWLQKVQIEEKKPNKEQIVFLKDLAQRLKIEVAEELQQTKADTQNEPLLGLVHGYPGTGKTDVINWSRRMFEEALGWTHGVQFVCLSFLNAMAANINGFTIHNWAGIPVGEEEGTAGTKDTTKMSTKCQNLRFVILDEISMVSAELLAVLEAILRRVIRVRSGYKKRGDQSIRAFGGVNMLFFGDWWQLQPVAGTALFSNPLLCTRATAATAIDLFWTSGKDTIRELWELTQAMRCPDPWYTVILKMFRHGNLTMDSYCLLHGFPTSTPGSWDPVELKTGCACGDDVQLLPGTTNTYYKTSWAKLFLNGHGWNELVQVDCKECEDCASARNKRCRVLPFGPATKANLRTEPFASAPAIFSYNVPKYFAVHLRAEEFAKAHGRTIHWMVARDVPLFHEDRSLPLEELNKKLAKWLQRHDQDTAHISSVLPLVEGLPVRLTETVDRKRRLYKTRRGFIDRWVQHPHEAQEPIENGILLTHMPPVIYVRFPGATWKIHPDLDPGLYPLTPVSRSWKVNKYTGVKARRTGYFLLPDFASTAHMIQGTSLDAVLCGITDNQIAAYVGYSRAKISENVWGLQPFSPWLFDSGAPTGPIVIVNLMMTVMMTMLMC